jgi:aspartate aminotransferase
MYLSSPSWDNHARIFDNVHLPIRTYPYYSKETNSIDIDGMMSRLEAAEKGSIILLQACAHNPTGLDPTEFQWQSIAQVIRSRGLFPFFDCAYQGFASGSLSDDNYAIRYFVEQGIELIVAQSFSKNLGLYGQRVGCFHFVAAPGSNAQDVVARVASQLAVLQRSEISTPPIYGAKLASIVLNSEQLFKEWEEDLRTMSSRIIGMRRVLRRELERLQTPGEWNHITEQIGMFSFTGLSEAQVIELRDKWHVYMLKDGRVSVAGLNASNINLFVRAVDDVVRRIKAN